MSIFLELNEFISNLINEFGEVVVNDTALSCTTSDILFDFGTDTGLDAYGDGEENRKIELLVRYRKKCTSKDDGKYAIDAAWTKISKLFKTVNNVSLSDNLTINYIQNIMFIPENNNKEIQLISVWNINYFIRDC